MREVIQYCENKIDCRRQLVLRYFGENFDPSQCNRTCDNCEHDRKSTIVDRTDYALKALKLSQAIPERHTLNQLSDMFKGSNSKRFAHLQELPFYGAGADLSRSEIERILQFMAVNQVFRDEAVTNAMGFSTTYLKIGPKANELLAGRMKISLTVCAEDADSFPSTASTSSTTRKSSAFAGKKRAVVEEDYDETEEFGHLDEYDLQDSFINDNSLLEEEEDVYGSSEHELPPRQPSPPPQVIKSLPQAYQSILDRPIVNLSVDKPVEKSNDKEKENICKPSHGSCYEALLAWRDSIAMSRKVNASFVMSNSIIGSIARTLPTSSKELSSIPGMTSDRVQNYSEEILSICSRYVL